MSPLQTWKIEKPYLKLHGSLLEGPYHDPVRNEFRFVDIIEEKFYAVDLNKGPESLRQVDTTHAVGVTAEIEGDDKYLLVGAKHGIAKLDPATGKLEYLRKIWDESDGPDKAHRMRLNDGACDPAGRFWVGAMNDPMVQNITDEGVLFRLDPDLTLHRIREKVSIPNGIGWNDAQDTMYWTDSATHSIHAFDYTPATGAIANSRVFYTDEKEPDGFAIDEEGCIWSAVYGGSRVVRISPAGEVIGEVSLPTRNVTCPTFVGTELFITTARDDDTEENRESAELSGSVFRVDVGVRGQGRGQGNGKHKFKITQ